MFKLYPSMALTNIKSSRKTYIPYMISCMLTISLYYIICSLSSNENLTNIYGGNTIQSYMGMGQFIVAIFAVIFLFYINSFLIKRRKKEFGLYNILGMEKRHIAKVIFMETLYTFLASFISGIILGILLDKLMYLVILRIFNESVPLGFYVSVNGIIMSLALFGIIFMLIFLNSVRQVYTSKPVELLKSDNRGEAEPKAKWVLAIIGVICLAAGYFIAVTTENPVSAFALFFVAVVLVIIGTYLVFTAGSIVLLKLLKKNKNYYYKTTHFVSISSMMYRMKRNAVGLGNICILSTMVLVMISATLSINLGLDDSFSKTHPREVHISAMDNDPRYEEVINITENAFKDQGLEFEDRVDYRQLSFSAVYEREDDYFVTDTDAYSSGMSSIQAYNDLGTLTFIPLEDYNDYTGKNETLKEDEVLVYAENAPLEDDNINIFDDSFSVKKHLDEFLPNGSPWVSTPNIYGVVVKDMNVMDSLLEKQAEIYGDNQSFIMREYMADIKGGSEGKEAEIKKASDIISAKIQPQNSNGEAASGEFSGYVECAAVEKETYGDNFIGLFFIGIFLSILFIMATVLIMYYKQITEGYEDKERYEILQNVGMSHKEVKKSINSQVLTVFFLPLITAGVHVGFAFPFIFRILTLLGLLNMKLYAMCNIGCFLVFALFYALVYMLTSKLYYGIVKK